MNRTHFWKFILDRLQKDEPVILLCVVDSLGSSPGRKGFKMAVAGDGMAGSIGGGIMEHKFAEMAKEKLKELPDEPLLRKQIHSKDAKKNQSGMICSGEQTIVLFHLTAAHADTVSRILASANKNSAGLFGISPYTISFAESVPDRKGFSFVMNSESDWHYEESLGYRNFLYIIGGGHCALAFSRLMHTMDFYIHLIDDRKDLNTFTMNDFVHEKTLVKSYEEIRDIIPSGDGVYAVIMTFGYRSDDIALRALIDKDLKYLGVLGSKSKISKMFDDWHASSLPEEKLKSIYAPVGMKINSRTPEEIAISIAAEIIKIKNN